MIKIITIKGNVKHPDTKELLESFAEKRECEFSGSLGESTALWGEKKALKLMNSAEDLMHRAIHRPAIEAAIFAEHGVIKEPSIRSELKSALKIASPEQLAAIQKILNDKYHEE